MDIKFGYPRPLRRRKLAYAALDQIGWMHLVLNFRLKVGNVGSLTKGGKNFNRSKHLNRENALKYQRTIEYIWRTATPHLVLPSAHPARTYAWSNAKMEIYGDASILGKVSRFPQPNKIAPSKGHPCLSSLSFTDCRLWSCFWCIGGDNSERIRSSCYDLTKTETSRVSVAHTTMDYLISWPYFACIYLCFLWSLKTQVRALSPSPLHESDPFAWQSGERKRRAFLQAAEDQVWCIWGNTNLCMSYLSSNKNVEPK